MKKFPLVQIVLTVVVTGLIAWAVLTDGFPLPSGLRTAKTKEPAGDSYSGDIGDRFPGRSPETGNRSLDSSAALGRSLSAELDKNGALISSGLVSGATIESATRSSDAAGGIFSATSAASALIGDATGSGRRGGSSGDSQKPEGEDSKGPTPATTREPTPTVLATQTPSVNGSIDGRLLGVVSQQGFAEAEIVC